MNIEQLPLAIGIGLAVSLIFSELFGLAPGGMVVPGYFALTLTQPVDILLTLLAAVTTFAIVHSLSAIIIIYGKRRTVLMILVGYLVGALFRTLLTGQFVAFTDNTFQLIGFIIPGLIAIWIDRQGMLETFSALISASVVVRLILILTLGTEIQR
jgi:poly-gamma-glutamate biosynthesis protein PgsC/CapC